MKKKKRNPKATLKDYSKFYGEFGGHKIADATTMEFYGLIRDKGRIKIDIKRLKKVKPAELPMAYLDAASAIPRNTTYFLPAKIHRYDYICNKFRDRLADLQKKWHENKQAFENIRTPSQVEDSVRVDMLIVLDYEEASEIGFLAGAKRQMPYYELYIALHANFIHQIASEMLALMLHEAKLLGYTYPEVSRNKLETFIEGTVNGRRKVKDLPHFDTYNNFLTVWNFLKHNSEELFDKVKERCPEMLLSDTYKNGELSQYILKIDDAYIEKTLHGLSLFFDEFCEAFFGDDSSCANWNYDEYFESVVQRVIRELNNPLDI